MDSEFEPINNFSSVFNCGSAKNVTSHTKLKAGKFQLRVNNTLFLIENLNCILELEFRVRKSRENKILQPFRLKWHWMAWKSYAWEWCLELCWCIWMPLTSHPLCYAATVPIFSRRHSAMLHVSNKIHTTFYPNAASHQVQRPNHAWVCMHQRWPVQILNSRYVLLNVPKINCRSKFNNTRKKSTELFPAPFDWLTSIREIYWQYYYTLIN